MRKLALVMAAWLAVLVGFMPANMMQVIPTPGIDGGTVIQSVAATNRSTIEATPNVQLPNNTVMVDRAIHPFSGQTITGPASLINNFTTDRSVLAIGNGLGYIDPLTVTGDHVVTLTDPSAAANYPLLGVAYFFKVDGFQTPGLGELRTLRGVMRKNAGALTLSGDKLDTRLTGGKWFTKALYVGNIKAGVDTITVPNPYTSISVGDNVLLTEGPSVANEGRDEWHRVIAVTTNSVKFARPTFRAYVAAVLAVSQPVTGVTLKNFTVQNPTTGGLEAVLLKYSTYWRVDTLTVPGAYNMAGCSYCFFTGCNFGSLSLNSCHDCTFTNCTIGIVGLEEACFNCKFLNCTFTGTFGVTTACESLSLIGCRLTGSGSYMGITGDNCEIQLMTTDGGTAFVIGQGNNFKMSGIKADCGVSIQSGSNCSMTNVAAAGIGLGKVGLKSSGVTVGCTPTPSVAAGSWIIVP